MLSNKGQVWRKGRWVIPITFKRKWIKAIPFKGKKKKHKANHKATQKRFIKTDRTKDFYKNPLGSKVYVIDYGIKHNDKRVFYFGKTKTSLFKRWFRHLESSKNGLSAHEILLRNSVNAKINWLSTYGIQFVMEEDIIKTSLNDDNIIISNLIEGDDDLNGFKYIEGREGWANFSDATKKNMSVNDVLNFLAFCSKKSIPFR